MKRKTLFLMAAVFLILAASLMAGCGDEGTTTSATKATQAATTPAPAGTAATTGRGQNEYKAELSGSNEEVAVSTEAKGEAKFNLSADGNSLTYEVKVEKIKDATASHIHIGAKGASGPVAVTLFSGSKNGEFSGTLAQGTITAADLSGPLAGKTLGDLIAELSSGKAYVNVHTKANPQGEIRGQIEST